MKYISFLFLSLVFGFHLFAQDPVKVDTVVVEKVKTDTVYVVEQQQAQQPSNSVLNSNRVYFGGYVGATFGSYTSVSVEPLIGYQLTKRLSLGGKFSYEYISDKRYEEDYSASNYGLSVFSRMRVTQRLYGHVEYSAMNYKLYDLNGESDRTWVPFLYVGGGIIQPISAHTSFYAEVLFDVLQNENSPYSDWEPFFSVGFTVHR